MRSHALIGTTAADGSLTKLGELAINGVLEAVQWVDGTLDDGVGFTLTVEDQGGQGVSLTLLTVANANSDAMYYPRVVAHKDEDGAALTGTTGGDRVKPVVAGSLKLVITSGGNAKTGGAIVYYSRED